MVLKQAFINEHPKYTSVSGIRAMFDRMPNKLVAYVQDGVRMNVGVLNAHLLQLAEKVEIPLTSGGIEYCATREDFIKPSDFDNIDKILVRGHAMFPDYDRTSLSFVL